MKLKNICLALTAIFTLSLLIVGCGTTAGDNKGSEETKTIKIGATSGPNAEILEAVKKEAEKEGLHIEIVEFSEYIQPNVALDNKDLDMNVYQHIQFMENAMQTRGYKFASIGKTYLLPYGLFSNKYKSFAEVPDGASVAIPNDPTNGGRGLALLDQAGLIVLKAGKGASAGVDDIVQNPHHLKILELEAAQLPRSLNDADLVAVPGNYVLSAGLELKNALAVEPKTSPFTIVVAVREADKDNPVYKKIAQLYQSEAVKNFVAEKYGGNVVPGF